MNDQSALTRLLVELKKEHRELDSRILHAADDPTFDQLELQRLKKRKLALKDRITKVESELLPDIIA